MLSPIGIDKSTTTDEFAAFANFEFFVGLKEDDDAVTRRLHVAFGVPSRALVDEFWRTGTEAGYDSDGEPGPRPQYSPTYYGAFLRDPDGNSVEAVNFDDSADRPTVDHIWLRVADVAASTRFYATIAPWAAFFVRPRTPDRTQFLGESGSFSVVKGEPTRNVHIAFARDDNWFVHEFHRVALEAGYRDNGGPGERSYHEGYYAAFVLDPDGNNVEVVNHNGG